MGYTLHWERKPELSAEKFAEAVEKCRTVTNSLGINIAGIECQGEPVFAKDQIAFNGAVGEGCEPFIFDRIKTPRPGREVSYGFCKTQFLPYRIAVQCCLIILQRYFADEMIIISDEADPNDWDEAYDLCNK